MKPYDLLQLPAECPQARSSDGTREQASRGYFKPNPFYTTSRCCPKFSNSIFVSQKQIWNWFLTANWKYTVQFWRHCIQLSSRIKHRLLLFREQFMYLFYFIYIVLDYTHLFLFTLKRFAQHICSGKYRKFPVKLCPEIGEVWREAEINLHWLYNPYRPLHVLNVLELHI